MGLGAHVREGCLLEEEASGAHCVGLKQTILLPFVTLGSLVNFCDCLMAGGTSREDHSEVGSSYIHFNYTPDGDKTHAVALRRRAPRGDARPASDLPGGPGRGGGAGAGGLRHGGGGRLHPARGYPRGRASGRRRSSPGGQAEVHPTYLRQPGASGPQQHRIPGQPRCAEAVVHERQRALLRRAGVRRPRLCRCLGGPRWERSRSGSNG